MEGGHCDFSVAAEPGLTPPEKCLLPFMKKFHQEPIVLDVGNVVASRKKVILTDKIYNENLRTTNKMRQSAPYLHFYLLDNLIALERCYHGQAAAP